MPKKEKHVIREDKHKRQAVPQNVRNAEMLQKIREKKEKDK